MLTWLQSVTISEVPIVDTVNTEFRVNNILHKLMNPMDLTVKLCIYCWYCCHKTVTLTNEDISIMRKWQNGVILMV